MFQHNLEKEHDKSSAERISSQTRSCGLLFLGSVHSSNTNTTVSEIHMVLGPVYFKTFFGKTFFLEKRFTRLH